MTEWKVKMYELSEKIIELAEKEGKLDQSNENVKSILSDIEALYANLEDEELREISKYQVLLNHLQIKMSTKE